MAEVAIIRDGDGTFVVEVGGKDIATKVPCWILKRKGTHTVDDVYRYNTEGKQELLAAHRSKLKKG